MKPHPPIFGRTEPDLACACGAARRTRSCGRWAGGSSAAEWLRLWLAEGRSRAFGSRQAMA
jgi:hypothetical protein